MKTRGVREERAGVRLLFLSAKSRNPMNCNFCKKALDEFITTQTLSPEERQAVVQFAMFMERKRLEEKIRLSIEAKPVSKLEVIC